MPSCLHDHGRVLVALVAGGQLVRCKVHPQTLGQEIPDATTLLAEIGLDFGCWVLNVLEPSPLPCQWSVRGHIGTPMGREGLREEAEWVKWRARAGSGNTVRGDAGHRHHILGSGLEGCSNVRPNCEAQGTAAARSRGMLRDPPAWDVARSEGRDGSLLSRADSLEKGAVPNTQFALQQTSFPHLPSRFRERGRGLNGLRGDEG
mmetsp:Transcript_19296/g.45992  ORF Transcript_19296/g.45992 Transcript_19296/m.45992 type:complete len:204 (+) Transcript_19296:61-672(+)